jgi:hypothetical protein
MLSKFISNQVLLLILTGSMGIVGCDQADQIKKEKAKTNQSQQKGNSKTVKLDQQQDGSQKCPVKSGKLNPSDVKRISLDSNPTLISGLLTADKALGYSFEGKKKQKLIHSTEDEFCMWVYTPNNQLLEGSKLPIDGEYIVQISIPSGAKTFEFSMRLNNPKPSDQIKTKTSSISKPNTNTPIVNPQKNPKEKMDNLADQIFNERHPELKGRKIQSQETDLAQEWKRIRNCQAVVDYRFYQRHPELEGKTIQRGETQLAQEWLRIKRSVSGCN